MLNDHRSNITCFHKKINTLPRKHHGAAAAGKKEEERKNLLREKTCRIRWGSTSQRWKNFQLKWKTREKMHASSCNLRSSRRLKRAAHRAIMLLSLGLLSSILIIKSKRTQEASSFILMGSDLAQNSPPLHCHLGNKDNPEQPESPLENPSSQRATQKSFLYPHLMATCLKRQRRKKKW